MSAASRAGQASLVEIVRHVYLRRISGRIGFDSGTGPLYFRDGEAFLAADHPLFQQVFQRLAALDGGNPNADKQLNELMLQCMEVTLAGAAGPRLSGGMESFPPTMAGPLPTVNWLMHLATHDSDEPGLEQLLGGAEACIQNSAQSPALQQLAGIDPEMMAWMAHLETPTPLGRLMQLHSQNRLTALRSLTRLWVVGLANGDRDMQSLQPKQGHRARSRRRRSAAAGSEPGRRSGGERSLSARALELFSERIAEDLAQNPLSIPADQHRARVASWLGRHASLSHYEIFQIDPRAGDEELHQAYTRLARELHPIHAEALDLQGRDEGLRVLFERVTEAYLVLSDPRRRASYDLLHGVPVTVAVDADQRLDERRRMAEGCYGNALHYLADHVQDFEQAINLLTEACRLDPKANYYSMLAQTLARNPHWRNRAAEAFKKALELAPQNAGIHVAFAEMLEKQGSVDAARTHFLAALDDMPNHPTALKAIERLGGQDPSAKIGQGLRRFFKHRTT